MSYLYNKQEPIAILPNRTSEQKAENYKLLMNKLYLKGFLYDNGIRGWPATNCDSKPLYEVSSLKFFPSERPVIG